MGTKLIGIAGPARAGKDTVADVLVRNFWFKKYSFAEPIRKAAKDILMLSEFYIEKGGKESNLSWVDTSYREFAQKLGTDFVRDMVDKDFWIKRAKQWINTAHPDLLVIPDVRFENESRFIRELGGKIWHVERDAAEKVRDHVSEAGVVRVPGDYVITNNESIDVLEVLVEKALYNIDPNRVDAVLPKI